MDTSGNSAWAQPKRHPKLTFRFGNEIKEPSVISQTVRRDIGPIRSFNEAMTNAKDKKEIVIPGKSNEAFITLHQLDKSQGDKHSDIIMLKASSSCHLS